MKSVGAVKHIQEILLREKELSYFIASDSCQVQGNTKKNICFTMLNADLKWSK